MDGCSPQMVTIVHAVNEPEAPHVPVFTHQPGRELAWWVAVFDALQITDDDSNATVAMLMLVGSCSARMVGACVAVDGTQIHGVCAIRGEESGLSRLGSHTNWK